MNSSSFMDKQVMGLSGSQNNDIFDLMNPQEEQQPINGGGGGGGGIKELAEEILPSYDFQPIRPVGASLHSDNFEGSNVGGTRVWNSADHKTNSPNRRNFGSIDVSESAEVIQEKDRNSYVAVTMSEIDQTMKKHADNLLHALEGVSARLSQLDTRTRHIESSVDDLKVSIANNHGNSDGKLRQLENILREVQTGVLVLRDKQEIAEAHFQLSKLQTTKGEQHSENHNTTYHCDSVQQQVASAPQLSNQSAVPPVALPQAPQPLPALPSNSPLPPAQQNVPPVQIPAQLPQTQISSIPQPEPHFPPPGQLAEVTHQHYQLTPPGQQPQPTPYQHYQSTNQLPHYSQSSHPPQQHLPLAPANPSPPQLQPALSHQPEETPYIPSQSYPPSIRQSPSINQPPSSVPPSQPFYGAPTHMYEPPPSNRPSPGFSSGYGGPPSGPNFSDSYPYSGSSHYGSSTMKPPQFSATPASSGGNSYPRIPTAQMLPHAVPTASSDGGGSSSSGSGNRVPIDDVVDKVATMGFSREQVRATVRKLTENGQSVDLNVVLDKLMNGR